MIDTNPNNGKIVSPVKRCVMDLFYEHTPKPRPAEEHLFSIPFFSPVRSWIASYMDVSSLPKYVRSYYSGLPIKPYFCLQVAHIYIFIFMCLHICMYVVTVQHVHATRMLKLILLHVKNRIS